MANVSSAYVTCTAGGKTGTWHFTGVLSIEHSLSLNLESIASQGTDIVNGARNQPNRVTLSVMETDAAHASGWSARMLEAMASLKRNRTLCKVVTSMGSYKQMLLTEINATQDGENQCGWKGTLHFVEYVPVTDSRESGKKTNNNSSTRKNTGSSGNVRKMTGTPFQQLLQRAGIHG